MDNSAQESALRASGVWSWYASPVHGTELYRP